MFETNEESGADIEDVQFKNDRKFCNFCNFLSIIHLLNINRWLWCHFKELVKS